MNGYVKIKFLYIFGAPVHIHWFALVVIGGLLTMSLSEPILAIITICSYFGIILLHEAGHAYFANKLGYQVFNVYLGFFHGSCEFEEPHTDKHNLMITSGGIITQLVVAIPLMILSISTYISKIYGLGPILTFLGYLNFIIALFNLVPIQGLDGEKIWKLLPTFIKTLIKQRKLKQEHTQKSERVVIDFIERMKKK